MRAHAVFWLGLVAASAISRAEEPPIAPAFRVRPYLQNPAPDAMTIRWLSNDDTPGTVRIAGRELVSAPVLSLELAYQPNESRDDRLGSAPFLHSVRVRNLEPATSYPYEVEQGDDTVKAILTTAPRPGTVGAGGGVRLFFYADCETQPESRGSRADWPPSLSLPDGPRPRWVNGRYPADETTGYRMNLALIATRAAESLRAKNPVLVSVVGDLVESGGEQRDWDEFWRHNAGAFGTLASRVPIVAALGNHELFGGPPSDDPAKDLGGYSGRATLVGSMKFLTYFEHPTNGAADERHENRYHRLDFGPVALLTLDTTNGGSDDGPDDTNHEIDRKDAPHVPDYAPGSEQYAWLERELADAGARGRIIFVQFHHAPFSSGPHGLPPGDGAGKNPQSGRPLQALADLLRKHGVRAVFSGHDEMYEHSIVDGVHYFDVGIGGDALRAPDDAAKNDRQVFLAHDHAPERWKGDVLESGGKHYGHIEVDVTSAAAGFTVTIRPVHIFPVLDPDTPGAILTWERREYDDVVTFDCPVKEPLP